ncbi:MAG: phosphoglycerate kinase [Chloroflexi bacterium]|nr:phosphoglycerate kinase [Chloroflexota bacterium]
MSKQSVRDVDVRGKRVLLRVDFNVPLDKLGNVTEDARIRASLPTIHHLLDHGAVVIAVSHLGRPDGKVVERLRMAPVAQRLSMLLGQPVHAVQDIVGAPAQAAAKVLRPGEVLLLENVRFDLREEKNDPDFARELAGLADVYVNDAFGTAHRAHATTVGVAAYLPAYAGLLMERELAMLGQLLERPERPFVVLIGGAKVSDKLKVLENLLDRCDRLLVGGGMANTFLRAQGYELGKSLVEEDRVADAKRILAQSSDKVLLPVDVLVADRVDAGAAAQIVAADAIPPDMLAVDIGPRTVERFRTAIVRAKTLFWNGPMGIFEIAPFASGTRAVAELVGKVRGTTVVGGGDSVAALEQLGYAGKVTHVSTGGGASLEFLEGRVLPGVATLRDRAEG